MNPDSIFALDPVTLSQLARALPREAIGVAMLFDGHRRLWEVVRDSSMTGRMTLSVVGRLASSSVIREKRDQSVAQEELYPPRPEPLQAITPWPMPKAISPEPVAEGPASAVSLPQSRDLVDTQRLPRMVVAPWDEPAQTEAPTLRIDSASLAIAQARPAPAQVAPPSAVLGMPALGVDEPSAPRIDQGQERPAPAACQPPAPTATRSFAGPRAAQAVAMGSPAAFDESDERFFESYVPEEGQIDTFWDLEDDPLRRLRARRHAQRLQQGGWFRQILSLF